MISAVKVPEGLYHVDPKVLVIISDYFGKYTHLIYQVSLSYPLTIVRKQFSTEIDLSLTPSPTLQKESRIFGETYPIISDYWREPVHAARSVCYHQKDLFT